MLTTRYAVILLARPDSRGVQRFSGGSVALPGLFVEPDPHVPLSKQVPRFLAVELTEPALATTARLEHILSPTLKIQDHGEATLLLCSAPTPWPDSIKPISLPELLRAMPHNKNRVPYMKAFQHLMGVASGELDVAELVPLK